MKYIGKKSGVTLVSLVITVIVIAIISSTLVYTGMKLIKKASFQTLSTDMLLIQAKAETIYEKLSFEKTPEELISALTGEKVIKTSEHGNNLLRAGVAENDIEKYYLWNDSVLESFGLGGIKSREKGYFYINYGSEIEVVSSLGFSHTDGNTYYKLSEIKNIELEEAD